MARKDKSPIIFKARMVDHFGRVVKVVDADTLNQAQREFRRLYGRNPFSGWCEDCGCPLYRAEYQAFDRHGRLEWMDEEDLEEVWNGR